MYGTMVHIIEETFEKMKVLSHPSCLTPYTTAVLIEVDTLWPVPRVLLRGTIVNRTYGTHKILSGIYFHIFIFNIWFYLLWSPVIASIFRLVNDRHGHG